MTSPVHPVVGAGDQPGMPDAGRIIAMRPQPPAPAMPAGAH
ncbi:hypothetical protein AOT14_01360 [Stenotrophomonas acidaminiphila]|uniref:Uncharacterized protein n=1 Tax=Stenotrophomonas acidaminiphila TaxID=128780 RepID=A0A0S1AUX8_9GAMM|nr:hypothetical protein AOT14_01360 [Stenotrophomonas acidaminiphila]